MKTLIPLLLFVLITATAPSFAQSEKAPGTRPGPVSYSDDEYDLLFEYPCGNATGEAGIETDGTYIYTSLWNGTEFCKYAADGTYLGTFSIPGVAAVRDMAYDGTYFYGAAANTTIFKMDFENLVLVGTIAAPVATRAIAYSQDYYDSFYVNNWSTPIVHFDILGQILNTIQTAGDESYYGFAYDEYETFLWGYSQEIGTSQNMLYKMELPSGWIVESFDVCTILSLPTPGIDIAGGLFINQDLVWESITIGGIVQNVCLWGLELYPFPQGPQYDVGVHSFISPAGGPNLGEEIVTIRVKNFSTSNQVISNIPVYYTLDGGTPVTGVVPGPIAPGQTEDFTFPGTVNLSNPGQSYVFYGCTTLEGDDNPGNDCKTATILHYSGYCPASTSIMDEYIAHVLCGQIDNVSGWQGSVADYTAISTSLWVTASEEITVTNGNPWSGDKVTVWVDWNNDTIFNSGNEEEIILTNVGGTGETFTGSITVPSYVPCGEYRMRIRMMYNTTPVPCDASTYGEIEDYTIVIGNSPLYPPTNLQVTINGNDVHLYWDSPEGDKLKASREFLGYNIYRDGTFIGFTTLNFYDDDDMEPGTYSFSVTAKYDEGESIPAGPVTIIVPPEAEISVNPESIIQNVPLGGTTQTILAISNTGGQDLTYNIEVEYPFSAKHKPEPYEAIEAEVKVTTRMADDGINHGNLCFSHSKPGETSPKQYDEKAIRYDNGVNFYAFGLYIPDDFEVAAYFPASTMQQYVGEYLSKISFYIHHVPEYCVITIHGQGSLTTPGPILLEQSVFTTAYSWNTYDLDNNIEISGQDLWIGYRLKNFAYANSVGYDEGPAVSGFGDMISVNNDWNALSSYGYNNNWNLVGYFDDGILPVNDVGIQELLSPVTGWNLGNEMVTIRVKNFGSNSQSNIPVFYSVDGGTPIAELIEGPLASGETCDYTFDSLVDLGSVWIEYLLKTYITLEGDELNGNNLFIKNIISSAFPYCDCITTIEDEYIANVTFGDINNSSGWQGGVANFTGLFATINAGASAVLTILNGNPWANDNVYAWIDWNQDFAWNYTEQYVLTNVGGTGEIFSAEIPVPQGQAAGNYRIRIRMAYDTAPTPGGTETYGEVEDYTLKVVDGFQGWLSVVPLTGTIASGAIANVSLHFDAIGLDKGIYTANLKITNNSANAPILDVPVTLIVGQCPLPPPLNPEGYEILPNIAYLSWQAPEIPGDLLGYNVYRDNEKINDTLLFNLFYEDSLANPQQYFYFITAVYPECETSSDTISLVITSLPEKENDGVRIFPNPAGDFINIQSNDEIEQITLVNHLGEVCYFAKTSGNLILIKTSDFPTGIFLLRVNTNTKTLTRKLLIQR